MKTPLRLISRVLPAKSIALIASLFMVSQAFADLPGTLDDRTNSTSYSFDSATGYGRFPVNAGDSTDVHDPRIERRFDGEANKIIPNGGTCTFQATYLISKANNTTIAQLLNYDASSSDTNLPVVFIIARPSADGTKWELAHRQEVFADVTKTSSFVLKLVSTGTSTKIYFNGYLKKTVTHSRAGDFSRMRYGAYHHGVAGTQADVKIKNVSWSPQP